MHSEGGILPSEGGVFIAKGGITQSEGDIRPSEGSIRYLEFTLRGRYYTFCGPYDDGLKGFAAPTNPYHTGVLAPEGAISIRQGASAPTAHTLDPPLGTYALGGRGPLKTRSKFRCPSPLLTFLGPWFCVTLVRVREDLCRPNSCSNPIFIH